MDHHEYLLFMLMAHVLFDYRATHSFVSANFVRKYGLVNEVSDKELYVDTSVGNSNLLVNYICKSCVIQICDQLSGAQVFAKSTFYRVTIN